MYDLLIRDATIVTSSGRQVADVAVQRGRIKYVGPRPPRPRARHEISAIGKFLMPGVVDTAVRIDDGGWTTESAAAVTGGVTTVLALPGADVVDAATARTHLDEASGKSWVSYGLWGRATGSNTTALASAIDDGLLVGGLATLGDLATSGVSPDSLDTLMAIPGMLGLLLDVSEQDDATVDEVFRRLRAADRATHLINVSTARELDLLDPLRGELSVTAGVTPHHLFLSADDMGDAATPHPPIRPEHDRRTLWTAVKRGRLDCVASDHHTQPSEGIPGSELLFPLMLSAVKYGRLSLELLVSLCSEAPARVFGLENKGRISKGADADLILFSEGEVARVARAGLKTGAAWSPYLDREAAPKPELVIVDGKIVAQRGELVGDTPCGRPIAYATAG